MLRKKLDSGWKLTNLSTGQCFAAKVPGSVYETWLENEAMEDPYWRDNEDKALEMMEDEYEYCLHMPVSKEFRECSQVYLQLEGLDTLADIYLNGRLLGSADNMHRVWEYSVSSILEEENDIRIVFHSPVRYIREAYAECQYDGSEESSRGFPFLRKAHCSFGWDWGPRLPDLGICRPVQLLGVEKARLTEVRVHQEHSDGKVVLSIIPELEESVKGSYTCEAVITAPDGHKEVYQEGLESILISNPQLWWPNGYGAQPLYGIEVILKEGDRLLDSWSRKIGLRTMTMNTSPDTYGSQFAHEVNGVSIFAMGADYIPEDCIRGRITPERTRRLLEQCRDCNFNVIRVWGGGYYPDDSFYDICDELGLLVWQDFMFACAVYRLTREFEETISAEIADNVKRLRHHACLGLWCGNNEMEMFVSQGNWIRTQKQKTEYLLMNQHLIPRLLEKYDPDTFYWPSSPSSGGDFDLPNDPDRGDAHYWDVWHGGVPFTEYRKFYFRYLSEFGFQSFPSVETIESFTEPGDRNIFSYVMEKHQRNHAANGKILQYLSQMYRYPGDLGQLVYASQLLQAEAIRYGAEHFRRNRGRCMGAVYWQLNDCWPVASWASIDYYGRWKALHYFAKRFFAPVLLSCEENGALGMDVNAEEKQIEKSALLCITNETQAEIKVCVKWSLRDSRSAVRKEGAIDCIVPPLSAVPLPKLSFQDMDIYGEYLSYELYQDNVIISEGTSLFAPPKHFRFENPELEITAEKDELIIKAGAFAKGVEISSGAGNLLLSDNYFDMNAGTKRVRVLEGCPQQLRIRSVYEIGR